MYVASDNNDPLTDHLSFFAGYALKSDFNSYRGCESGKSDDATFYKWLLACSLLIPLYLLMKNYHLLNTYYSMILAYDTFMSTLCTFMLKGYFDSLLTRWKNRQKLMVARE